MILVGFSFFLCLFLGSGIAVILVMILMVVFVVSDYCSTLEGDESYSCWRAYFELKDLEVSLFFHLFDSSKNLKINQTACLRKQRKKNREYL